MTPTREVVRPAPVQTTQNHRAASLLYGGRIGFLCTLDHEAICPVHKKAALHRTVAVLSGFRERHTDEVRRTSLTGTSVNKASLIK